MKWIRWSGFVPFLVIITGLSLTFILLIDSLIEWGIESTGSDIVNAKVELENAEFKFSPLGITLNKLQVTNPDAPMSNAIEIDRIAFLMEGSHLIRRKLLINEMNVDGVKLNTPRKYSGELTNKTTKVSEEKDSKKDPAISLPSFDTPNVDEILKKEPLKIDQASKILKTDITDTEASWRKIKEELPDKKRYESYEARLNAIRKVNYKDVIKLKAAIDELKALKNDISADGQRIKQGYQQIVTDSLRLNSELKTLINSPGEDYKYLLNKYSLSTQGATNLGVLFFGDKTKLWSDTAIYWYKKLQPYISKIEFSESNSELERERGEGKTIHFTEINPQPDFLIKKVHAGIELASGKFKGNILNISSQQRLVGRPITFEFTGSNMSGIQSLKLNGEFNRLKSSPKDFVNLAIRQYNMDSHSLLNEETLSVVIDKAKSDLHINAKREGNNLNATVKNFIHNIKFNNKAAGGGEIKQMLVAALNDISSFNINGRVYGTFDKYHTRISTDLDNKLGANLKSQVNKLKKNFQVELKNKLNSYAKPYTDDAKNKVNVLRDKYEKEIQAKKNQFEQQIASAQKQIDGYKAQIKNKEQELKNKAKKKIESKIQDKLKGLFK